MSIRRVPNDLTSIIHHAVEASAPLLENAGLSYDVVLPDSPIYIEADAARLAQVIGNSQQSPKISADFWLAVHDTSSLIVIRRQAGLGSDRRLPQGRRQGQKSAADSETHHTTLAPDHRVLAEFALAFERLGPMRQARRESRQPGTPGNQGDTRPPNVVDFRPAA